MKHVIFVCLFAAAALQVSAQSNRNTLLEGAAAENNFQNLKKLTTSTGTVQTYDNRYKGLKGTPFFWSSWTKGNLLIGDKKFENVTVKYNLQDDELWYQDAKGNAFVLPAIQLTSFKLTDSLGLHTVAFERVPAVKAIAPDLANKFFVILHEGQKSRLVLAPQKKLLKADFKGPYSTGREYDQLVDTSDFFLLLDNGNVQKVSLTSRSLLKAIPNNQAKVKEFVKSNKVDLESEQGWVKALTYYDTL